LSRRGVARTCVDVQRKPNDPRGGARQRHDTRSRSNRVLALRSRRLRGSASRSAVAGQREARQEPRERLHSIERHGPAILAGCSAVHPARALSTDWVGRATARPGRAVNRRGAGPAD
jgi:hypothetical protein